MTPVPASQRLRLAVLFGLVAGLKAGIAGAVLYVPRDLGQVWFAARAFLHGQDPYALIGPGHVFEWRWPLYYPLTAAVAVIPLTPLPVVWAGAVFMAIAGGCFAWALMEHGYPPLLGFVSTATVLAIQCVQWSPLLAASFVLPPLAFFAAAKPTLGAAFFVARPTRWAVVGALVLGGIAFLGQPDWVVQWRAALARGIYARPSGFHFTAPISVPGGVFALACLLRWRRPEARLVAAMACVPQTLIVYEAVPLFLVPRTRWECAGLVVSSYVAQLMISAHSVGSFDMVTSGRWVVWLLYLPATLMVLRRPNEGTVPAWLDRRLASWPPLLRGVPSNA